MANTTGKKFGGREKGTPNKLSTEIKEAFQLLIESNIDNLEIWIQQIAKDDPAKAMEIIIKLSEFVVPKLQRSEIKTDHQQQIVGITFDK